MVYYVEQLTVNNPYYSFDKVSPELVLLVAVFIEFKEPLPLFMTDGCDLRQRGSRRQHPSEMVPI